MAVRVYSKSAVGNMDVSKNFKFREFASKDGVNTVKIDDLTLSYLQAARDYFDILFMITSGYRSPAHNKKVGGAANSYHVQAAAGHGLNTEVLRDMCPANM